MPPEGRVVSEEKWLAWCDLARVDRLSEVRLDVVTYPRPKTYMDMLSPGGIAFSPDSRYLAATSRGSLVCIDLETSRTWPLAPSDERVTSFVWSGPEEIRYVAPEDNRRFFAHRIHERPEERETLFGNVGPAVGYGGPRQPSESWSPKGRFALFVNSLEGNAIQLLDMRTCTVRAYAHTQAWGFEVAWRKDESAVFFIGLVRDSSAGRADSRTVGQALLLQAPAWNSVDDTPFVEQLRRSMTVHVGAAGLPVFHLLRLEPQWTEDGEYLLLNSSNMGGYLIKPDPWKMNPCGQFLFPSLGYVWDRKTHDPSTMGPPTISFFPADGWIQVLAGNLAYAYNYNDLKIAQLADWHVYENDLVVTPDGRTAVWVDLDGRVRTPPIDLSTAKGLKELESHGEPSRKEP